MFRINLFKTSRKEKDVPNNVRASARTKPITVSQPPIFTKKDVNSDSNCLSSIELDNTKTRRPQPMSNTKNDRVPSASKSSRSKNKGVEVIQVCLWCVDSGCSKHMTRNLKLFINFVWKFMGTVRFENDHVAAILGFGDLQWGNILITGVYFIEGFGHNFFSIGQFCLQKFKYDKEHICPSCKQGKSKRASHPPKPVPNSRQRLHLLQIDLCGPMRIANINRKRTKKIMETVNVSFDELSAMAFEQRSSKPGLQSMTSRQISSGLDLTYAPSTTTTQQPTECELDLLFEAMYDDYIGGQPLTTARTDLGFKLTGFSDADYAGCKDTFKSTSGEAHFLGEKLEHIENGTIELDFVKTDYQLADLFTKALPADCFNYLVRRLYMRSLSPQELDRLAKS
nr:integrase, catalytic region, zinc finger, CCHC-type, peptidase aspartic, catalytic [Tanacetum cinerariifolium]